MPWPTVLHRMVSEEIDDLWTAVVERTKSHPHEVGTRGAGYGQTAVHVACYRYPPENAVRAMLDVCPEAAAIQNQDGETPLHLACEGASEQVQMMLIDTRREAASRVDKYGDAPLHLACESGSSMELLTKLVAADPSVVLLPNKKGVTPFFKLAKEYEHAETIEDLEHGGEYADEWEKARLLLNAACYGSVDVPEGVTFRLLHAVAGVHCPMALVRLAARLYPEQAVERDEAGRTPLSIAACAPIYDEPEDEDETHDDEEEEDEDDEDEEEEEEGGDDEDEHDRDGAHQPRAQVEVGGNNNNNREENSRQQGPVGVEDEQDSDDGGAAAVVGQHPANDASSSSASDSGASGYLNGRLHDPATRIRWPTAKPKSKIDIILRVDPMAARVPDADGRLPLALALESGKEFDQGPSSLLLAAPRLLETRDVKTHMYPFMIAAAGSDKKGVSLNTVYQLLRRLPELVQIGLQGKKRKESGSSDAVRRGAGATFVGTGGRGGGSEQRGLGTTIGIGGGGGGAGGGYRLTMADRGIGGGGVGGLGRAYYAGIQDKLGGAGMVRTPSPRDPQSLGRSSSSSSASASPRFDSGSGIGSGKLLSHGGADPMVTGVGLGLGLGLSTGAGEPYRHQPRYHQPHQYSGAAAGLGADSSPTSGRFGSVNPVVNLRTATGVGGGGGDIGSRRDALTIMNGQGGSGYGQQFREAVSVGGGMGGQLGFGFGLGGGHLLPAQTQLHLPYDVAQHQAQLFGGGGISHDAGVHGQQYYGGGGISPFKRARRDFR